MRVMTAAQMRKTDQLTIETIGIPGVVLMERAALAVTDVILERLRHLDHAHVGVFCGSGQNGGDGFAIARMLHHQNIKVTLFLLHHPNKLTGDAKVNWDILENLKIPRHILEDVDQDALKELLHNLGPFDLWCDAMLGTGLHRRVEGIYALAIEHLNDTPQPIIAVDIPSGIHADTGKQMGIATKADTTVTLAQPKIGLLLQQGRTHSGKIVVADIGIPNTILEEVGCVARWLHNFSIRAMLSPRPLDTHKGSAGKLLLFAGSDDMKGAAIIASHAAIAGGAGLVTVGTSKNTAPWITSTVPEAISKPLVMKEFTEETLESLRLELDRADVVAAGPGLGQGEEILPLIRHLLFDTRHALVLDADALNILSASNLQSQLRHSAQERDVILTPHPGEMARLTDANVQDIIRDPLGYASTLANTTQCIIVLKGATTVIASPDGRFAVYTGGHPGMASAGMGDALTGLLAARLGEQADAFEAACTAVWIHGKAGTLAKEADSERATRAMRVIDFFGAAFKSVTG